MQFSEFSVILSCLRTYRLQAEENLCVRCFLQADAFDARHTVEIAVYNACLAIAQLGVQPACRLILYVGVHALLMRSLPADTKLHAQGLFFCTLAHAAVTDLIPISWLCAAAFPLLPQSLYKPALPLRV